MGDNVRIASGGVKRVRSDVERAKLFLATHENMKRLSNKRCQPCTSAYEKELKKTRQ